MLAVCLILNNNSGSTYSTETVYLDWVGRFIGFYQLKTNNLCLKTPGKRWENI
ncbi:hypothetical protein THERMOS_1696 [Bathymodiolus thermophilus thioautotrophic gill symbiont]|uniref:Uncharacterized protein n=1 Tax=Bathymodiolus thermophilus thioautotrophic gill symbiont TaxID=2360 RepID=A0A8H8XEG9_9GAMM|nr:hypothetical protein THERMOS_1696 [Bathymodiolus thermophilus thioautotrophic gill symbiont]